VNIPQSGGQVKIVEAVSPHSQNIMLSAWILQCLAFQ